MLDEIEPNLCQDGNREGGSHMRALIKVLVAAVALAMSTGAAFAVIGKTTTDVALRIAPAAQAELILNIPEGALVNVGPCSRGWCGVTYYNYGGYVRESALQLQSTPAGGPPAIPVYPPYPYKAGHYPTAEAYYDLPPYAATNPSFYRWRFFMIGQERNRYRYMPHVFHGYSGYSEDTVGSYATTPASKPMSPTSPPKAEPSPAAPTGVSEPKKEGGGSSGEPGPAGSTSPQAPAGSPPGVPGPEPVR